MFHDIERWLHDCAAERLRLRGSFMSARHTYIRSPVCRDLLHAFVLLELSTHAFSVKRVDGVELVGSDGRIVRLPTKQLHIELFCRRAVRGHQFDPTETSRLVFQLSLRS